MADRTLFDGLSHTGGWELDVELDEVAIPDRSGRPFVIARVPRIERRFASPMHTVAGMAPRLGSWRDELSAFLAGGGRRSRSRWRTRTRCATASRCATSPAAGRSAGCSSCSATRTSPLRRATWPPWTSSAHPRRRIRGRDERRSSDGTSYVSLGSSIASWNLRQGERAACPMAAANRSRCRASG
jgi:hypothetical protein